MNAIDLKGRTAIVTGGARGIGFATAQKMLALRRRGCAVGHRRGRARQGGGVAGEERARLHRDPRSHRRGGDRQSRRGADPRRRQDRHPGQQCRHHRRQRAAVGAQARRLAPRHRGQPRRAIPRLPRGRAAYDGRGLRTHRQHRLDRRQGRQSERLALFGVESRPDRVDEIAGQGIGDHGRAGERHHAGGGQDRNVRPDDASSISTTCCRKSR